MKNPEFKEKMAKRKAEMDAQYEAAMKKADEMTEEECDKAFADFSSPNMHVPAQKSEKATDIVKALRGIASKDSSDEINKAMLGAIERLGAQVENLQKAVLVPPMAAAKVVDKADDQTIIKTVSPADDLKKAQEAKDGVAGIKALHKLGGKPVLA